MTYWDTFFHEKEKVITETKAVPQEFTIPTLAFLGKQWNIPDPYVAGYALIVNKLIARLIKERNLYNWREGEIDADHIRIYADVKPLIEQLETDKDYLTLTVDLGTKYKGVAPIDARKKALKAKEIPLPTAYVALILLGHKDILTTYEDTWLDCAGDEWDWSADGRWSYGPYFYYDDGQLGFSASDADYAYDVFGSPVVFPGGDYVL